jgi:hypothetical protein
MCGNRVEELEELVKELEASVEGLTDELVECKVRIRELENTVDEQKGFGADEPARDSAPEPTDSDPEGETSTEDEILTPGADTSKPDGTNEVDNKEEAEAASDSESDEDSGSDIIVA